MRFTGSSFRLGLRGICSIWDTTEAGYCDSAHRIIWVSDSSELPIRSIDFYYPEFQAANVRMFRDKSKMCFLEPTWSNLCRNLLNLLDKNISPMPTSPIISKRVLPVGGGLKCGNFGSQIGMKKVLDLQIL